MKCEDLAAERVKLLMSTNTMEAESSGPAALRFLERYCCLCAKQLTNQQDWRRRMKKERATAWRKAEKIASASIILRSACPFSSSLINVEDTAALNEVAHRWGASSPMAASSEEELTQHKPRKGRQEAERAREPASRGRPQQDLPTSNCNNWHALWPGTKQHYTRLKPGRGGHHSAAHANNCQLEEESRPWRVQLWPQASLGHTTHEAVARMQKLSADQPAQQRLSKVKLLCAEPLGWNYMRWNQDKQCYEATDATPLPHDQAIKAGQMLTERMVKDVVLHAFHAMGGYVDGQGQSHNVQAHTLAGRP